MATKSDLYNGAARLLKERRFVDITVDDVPLRHELDAAYAGALAYVLEQAQWNFAKRSAAARRLIVGDPPVIPADENFTPTLTSGYAFRYQKPTDYVRLIAISASSTYYPPLEAYDENGEYWHTNETSLYITYVSDDASFGGNLALWPETYAKVVEAYLAKEVGPHITNDTGLLSKIEAEYEAALQFAIAKDAINRTVRVLSSATRDTYNAVLRMIGGRLTRNFDDKMIGRRIYDANGEPATRQSQGAPPSLPAYDAEAEEILRRLLDEAYAPAVAYLLEQGLWNFASRTVAIEEETDVEPSFGYSYVFEKPSDYVRLVAIADNGTLWPTLDDYLDEGAYWHANVAPLYIQYVSDGASYGNDSSLWPASFKRLLETYLAVEIYPHAPRASARGLEALREIYVRALRDARAKDAFNQAAIRPPPGRLSRSRAGYRNGRTQRREN